MGPLEIVGAHPVLVISQLTRNLPLLASLPSAS